MSDRPDPPDRSILSASAAESGLKLLWQQGVGPYYNSLRQRGGEWIETSSAAFSPGTGLILSASAAESGLKRGLCRLVSRQFDSLRQRGGEWIETDMSRQTSSDR